MKGLIYPSFYLLSYGQLLIHSYLFINVELKRAFFYLPLWTENMHLPCFDIFCTV